MKTTYLEYCLDYKFSIKFCNYDGKRMFKIIRMTNKKNFLKTLGVTCLMFLFTSSAYTQERLEGAWSIRQETISESLVFVEGYVSHVVFDLENKKFISTRGGKYKIADNRLVVEWQYDTEKAQRQVPLEAWLGQESDFTLHINNKQLHTNFSNRANEWLKLDDMPSALSGVWRMSGRKQGEELSITPLRDRRTLKILTGTRFQWVAINIKTGQFLGTGGGKYTFENGKYTEHIEFFSRDDSRTGTVLAFQGELVDGQWHHSGSSSSGNFIYEIWEKLEE